MYTLSTTTEKGIGRSTFVPKVSPSTLLVKYFEKPQVPSSISATATTQEQINFLYDHQVLQGQYIQRMYVLSWVIIIIGVVIILMDTFKKK